MRRPLAFVGLVFLVTLLAALRLPAWAVWLCAGLLAAGFVPAAVFLRTRQNGLAPLLLGAALAALVLRGAWDAAFVRPVEGLAGRELAVTARVTATAPGYGEDTVRATLKVLRREDGGQTGFLVQADNLPALQPGDAIDIRLRFYGFGDASARLYNYGKGFFIGASAVSAPQHTGRSDTPLTLLRRLQYAAANNVAKTLPARLSGVAAAMSVGDRRFLGADTREAYRMAGLSHVLVVSGLHLSIVGSSLHGLLQAMLRRRRLAAGLCMGFTLGFMLLTGLAASVVRAGVVMLLYLLAQLLDREADVFTSLGLAAVLLLAFNPYACGDAGLLLSFAATLGTLGGGRLQQRLKTCWQARPAALPLRAARRLARAAVVPVCVTAATFPVLVYAGMGTSLLAVPANIVAVPFVKYIVTLGLFLAVLPSVPLLGLLAEPLALLEGLLLVLMEKLTALCAAVPGAWVPLGGAFGLVAVLVFYALALLAFKTRRPAAAVSAALTLPLALALHMALNTGTVRVEVAAGGANPSLVVTRGGQAAVLYRGRQTAGAVRGILRQNRAGQCVLLADLRRSAAGTETEAWFAPQTLVVVGEEVTGRVLYSPLEDVTVLLARQAGANLAVVDVAGFKIGLASGAADFAPYTALDALLAGGSEVSGEYAVLLAAGAPPGWAPDGVRLLRGGGTVIWIRPGKSAVFREVDDGVWN